MRNAKDNFERITSLLKVSSNQIHVYLYPDLTAYHQAAGWPDMQDWMVGHIADGAIHIVSPTNPGPMHDFDSILKVAVHEFVHIAAEILNPTMDRPFIVEGLAMYLAGQNENVDLAARYMLSASSIPDVATILGHDWGIGIYEVGYAFIEFIVAEFGMTSWCNFMQTLMFSRFLVCDATNSMKCG